MLQLVPSWERLTEGQYRTVADALGVLLAPAVT
jgi:hypothetical protein